MSDWLDYAAEDFLLFSPEAYWRLFELMNGAAWPAQPLVLAAFAALTVAVSLRRPWAVWAALVGLALAWAATAYLFLQIRYQPINWAITWVIPAFWVQVGLLVLLGPGRGHSHRRIGIPHSLILLALAYPLVGMVAGRPILQAEVVGLSPDPTAILTLGFLGLSAPAWRAPIVMIIPMGWLLISAATLLTMGQSTGWVLLLSIALGVAAICLPRRSS
ncbi:MAG: hypothetical protein AAGJ28_17095 [Pseudomonadota bacterium]